MATEITVLSFNAGYWLGYDGTVRDYLRHPLRGAIGASQERDLIRAFADVIEDVDPDIVALQEVDQGSIRTVTNGQVPVLAAACDDGFSAHTAVKYGDSLLARLPVFRYMANGALYRDGEITDHILNAGMKSLVQEIEIGDTSVFSVHLARFGSWTRKRQLRELADLAQSRENAVIIGDFNTLGGPGELTVLQDYDFTVSAPEYTFPAKHPVRILDGAAYTTGIDVDCEVLDVAISDHRPVLATITE